MGILSIQSHVSYGVVGNTAGVFVLRRMGFDVWPVHTVYFSNHPGYGTYGGQVFPPELVSDIISGIEKIDKFQECQAIISGYLGSADNGRVTLDAVSRIKLVNPDAVFFLDPVIGDVESGPYVDQGIIDFYVNEGLPQADVLKPNCFELRLLSGMDVNDVEGAVRAARSLIERGSVKLILVSSIPLDDGRLLAAAAVTADEAWSVITPALPPDQKGAGDTFLALFAGHYLQGKKSIGESLQSAVSSIWHVTEATHHAQNVELQLIAAQDQILAPSKIFDVNKVTVKP